MNILSILKYTLKGIQISPVLYEKLPFLSVLTKNSKRIIAEDMLGLGKYQEGTTRTSEAWKTLPSENGGKIPTPRRWQEEVLRPVPRRDTPSFLTHGSWWLWALRQNL